MEINSRLSDMTIGLPIYEWNGLKGKLFYILVIAISLIW